MTKRIRIGSKWIKKGKTKRTLIQIDNVSSAYGRGNTVYFHSDATGTGTITQDTRAIRGSAYEAAANDGTGTLIAVDAEVSARTDSNLSTYAVKFKNDGNGNESYGLYGASTDTAVKNLIANDNIKSYFGTGEDSSMYYDGTNMIFDTNETGSGIAWFSNNISAVNVISKTSFF